MKVELVSLTMPVKPEFKGLSAEELIVAIARVSNPSNQLNTATAPKLLRYCADNGHWSVFAMVDFTVEIETSRGIAAQILRHKSADFQEFSLRYAVADSYEPIELRLQGIKNKQGSQEIFKDGYSNLEVEAHIKKSFELYKSLIGKGVSRETARFVLPLNTTTTLYMKNSVRNWLAYLNVRLHNHCQKEHRLVAEQIRDVMLKEFPVISEAFDNFKTAYTEKFM